MGSSSSGWYRGGKRTTDDMHALDVRRLARDGRLTPGAAFNWSWSRRGTVVASIQIWPVECDRVRLMYRTCTNRFNDEWRSMDYSVKLIHTPCAFGGERVWWQCPTVGCGRRVAVLFGGGVYACRHCHKLAYESQREPDGDEHYRRANKIRARLGWPAGIANYGTGRPKGMHAKTYLKLLNLHNRHSMAAFGSMDAMLESVRGKLGRIGR